MASRSLISPDLTTATSSDFVRVCRMPGSEACMCRSCCSKVGCCSTKRNGGAIIRFIPTTIPTASTAMPTATGAVWKCIHWKCPQSLSFRKPMCDGSWMPSATSTNVLWEICNEAGSYSTEWQYHFIRFIKAEERNRSKQHPVGMTFQWSPDTKAARRQSTSCGQPRRLDLAECRRQRKI